MHPLKKSARFDRGTSECEEKSRRFCLDDDVV
ncbi:hypothetical protein Gogos_020494 [Gossypium gossypioides]|uniref:Uncharacterized protein n=1 Tax=Gossypium gossypioides TaxID=34282 RepID=A0A7J9D5D3_GOSGO|nr:hypothetical protein [Gossypium gossypioides]